LTLPQSADIKRSWPVIEKVARQNLNATGKMAVSGGDDRTRWFWQGTPAQRIQSHATSVYASGGMVLSGDD